MPSRRTFYDQRNPEHRSWTARRPACARAGRQRRGCRGGCDPGVLRRHRHQARANPTARSTPISRVGRPQVQAPRRSSSAVLDDGKHLANADTILASIDEFDVIIVDRTIGGSALVPAESRRLPRPRRATPGAGMGDDQCLRHRRVACDISSAARSPSRRRPGLLAAVRDPVDAGTDQARRMPGAALGRVKSGALAACDGVSRRNAGQSGVHLDVSACEAAIATGPVLQCVSSLLHCSGAIGAKRYGAPAGYFPASDGMVRISAMEDHQWRGIADAYDRPDLVDRWPTAADRSITVPRSRPRWRRSPPANRRPSARRCCNGPVCRRPLSTARPSSWSRRSSRLVDPSSSSTSATARCAPWDCRSRSRAPACPAGTCPSRRSTASGSPKPVTCSRHRWRVRCWGRWARTSSSSRTPTRIDMYRRRGPYVNDEPGENNAAYFALVNHSKRSMTIDLAEDRAALTTLLSSCDVLVENFGPSRARKFGLDAASLRDFLSSSPGRQLVGLRAPGTLVGISDLRVQPARVRAPWCTSRGPVRAIRSRSISHGPTSSRDTRWPPWSPRGPSAAARNEGAADRLLDGRAGCGTVQRVRRRRRSQRHGHVRRRNEPPAAVRTERRVPDAADGRFVAISVLTDAHWRALCARLDPSVSSDDRWLTADGRQQSADALDEAVRRPSRRSTTGRDLAAMLQEAGVPAAFVVAPGDLPVEPRARRSRVLRPDDAPDLG